MKQVLASVQTRGQVNELLARVQPDAQDVARQDMDRLVRSMRSIERQVA